MYSRLRSLRLFFGLNHETMAELLGWAPEELRRLEAESGPLPAERTAEVARRFGVSPSWLDGADQAPMLGDRLLALRPRLREQIVGLAGMRLMEVLTATTGERIAYALRLMHKADPDLCSLECVAAWLGLSLESTELLVQGELTPGAPVVARASELTGLPERWFRQGILGETEQGDLE